MRVASGASGLGREFRGALYLAGAKPHLAPGWLSVSAHWLCLCVLCLKVEGAPNEERKVERAARRQGRRRR